MVLQALRLLVFALLTTPCWGQDEQPAAASPTPTPLPAMELLGQTVQAGLRARLSWRTGFGYGLNEEPVPVLVSHGGQAGPVLCLTAAVHGDELNGIEIVRRIMTLAQPNDLRGTVIGVPVVNVHGFHRRSRYLPDRRDLNRHFPGSATGSFASRVAHDFFTRVIRHCSILVDVHTGSFYRSNLPQLRADLRDEAILDLTQYFGAMTVLHSRPAEGTLRRAAQDASIPAVTMEVGEPNRLQAEDVALAVRGLKTLLAGLEMIGSRPIWDRAQPVYYESEWVRADRGGILFSTVELGQKVRAGEVLGTVTDPLSNVYVEIASPIDGRVLGKALNQFVMPGFAAFRIGVETAEPDVIVESGVRSDPEAQSDDSALEQPDMSPVDEQERLP
nr:succinylglutamate desuccinylase/aspartoacylase family protein [Oceanococcus sp. HetDA_MAG_MS8]